MKMAHGLFFGQLDDPSHPSAWVLASTRSLLRRWTACVRQLGQL